jgi:hypothetical protein
MQPFQADYSGIGSSIGNIFQYELMQSEKSQLQGARQLADAKAMETLSNIDWGKLTDETRNYLKSTGLARAQLGYAKEQQEVDNMAMTGLIMRSQRAGMLLLRILCLQALLYFLSWVLWNLSLQFLLFVKLKLFNVGKINHNVPNRIPYVCNRDLDLFLKRLRSYYPDDT